MSTSSHPPGSKLGYVRLRATPAPGTEREHAAAAQLLSPTGHYKLVAVDVSDGAWTAFHLFGQMAPFNAALFEESSDE